MELRLTIALVIFVAVYALLIWDKINRAIVALLGASALVVLGVLNQEAAIRGIDFNTLGLLLAMMAIVAICQKTGMFQYLAIRAAKLAGGDPWRILVAMSIVTAVVSAFLDNVTTVLLTVPITFLIADVLKVNIYPFLVAQVLSSNIGGTATLIGDPPNIMIGSAVGLTFMDFVWNVGVIIPVVMTGMLIPMRLIYAKDLKASDEVKGRIMQFKESEAIQDMALLKKCLAVLAVVIGAFIFQGQLRLEAATIALFGAAFLMLISREDLHSIMEKAEWTSIFFFLGLFVVVHSLVETGLIKMAAAEALRLTGGDVRLAGMVILWASAIASAFIDNIPFVATMIPLIKDMAGPLGGADAITPLWWALSLGACLGGNGSLIGASANVVVAGMAAKNGHPMSFIKFTKLAFPLMLISIFISTVYMYLRYFL